MRLKWSAEAKRDLEEIVEHIWLDNPAAARRMRDLFRAASRRLVRLPHAGRPGRLPGTRELIPHESYRMVYQVDDDTVWVLALVHTARRWPPVVE